MKLIKKVMTAVALAALACSPANAIDRIGWSKTKETMYVHGDFEYGDAARIYETIQENRRNLRGIIFNSGGGLVTEGVRLARLIKGKDYDTGVTRGGVCASACFMTWAAGRNRYLYADSQIGIHSAGKFNTLAGKSVEDENTLAITTEMARMYRDLNVPKHLIGIMVITPTTSIYWLNASDLQGMDAKIMN